MTFIDSSKEVPKNVVIASSIIHLSCFRSIINLMNFSLNISLMEYGRKEIEVKLR